jgi:type II secretory pathway component GspD/PulD (secretin)
VIRRSLAETSVMVRDGVTVIIGGMIQNRKDKSVKKVPLLGSIPLLGFLFRFEAESTVNTEIVVFMTPRVVTGDRPHLRMRDLKKQPKPLRTVGRAPGKDLRPLR